MNTTELLTTFYEAFAAGNTSQMTACYDDNIIFSDPAFGLQKGIRAKAMWHMLQERSAGQVAIDFKILETAENSGTVHWIATYLYGPKKRPVTNEVTARFKIRDHKIIEHHDTFDMYKWSKQALGLPGHLLGWSRFMQSKVQSKTNHLLTKYMEKQRYQD